MRPNIVVCIKQVPDPDYFNEITVDPETGRIRRENVPSVLNPLDENALEEALRIGERFSGRVTALSMGPPPATEILEWALTLGADEAILLCDRAFAGADSLATAYALAGAIEKIRDVDLIICGNRAVDGGTQQVGPQVAQLLGIPHTSYVRQIDFKDESTLTLTRSIEYGHMIVEVDLPAVISVLDTINEPRPPTAEGIMTMLQKEYREWTAEDIDVPLERLGLDGSPTKWAGSYEQSLERRREILSGTPEQMVSHVLHELREQGLLKVARGAR
jgi:electron transfer flavoprotein beta subunit